MITLSLKKMQINMTFIFKTPKINESTNLTINLFDTAFTHNFSTRNTHVMFTLDSRQDEVLRYILSNNVSLRLTISFKEWLFFLKKICNKLPLLKEGNNKATVSTHFRNPPPPFTF